MKSKIAFIIEHCDAALGGAERSISELAEATGALGFETHIIAAKGKAINSNVHVLCADNFGKRTSYKLFARAIKKHIEQNHYDILHSVLPFDFADIYQPRSGTFAESIIRKAETYPAILQGLKRKTAFLNFRRTAWFDAERRLSEGKTGPLVIAISDYVAGQFRTHYNISENRMIVIANGIKPTGLIEKAKSESLRAKLLAQSSKEAKNLVLFLFAGHDFKRKGLDCLVKAMGEVQKTNNNMSTVVIVAGRGNSSAYRRMAQNLGVAEKVIFLGDVKNVQELITASDVAVLPTFDDPCSRFILEALAAGKPVITTKFNGAADLFTDNRHGKVIDDPRNISALSEAIGYFLNPENLNQAANAIISDNLRQNVSVSRVAAQLKTIYEKILKGRGRR